MSFTNSEVLPKLSGWFRPLVGIDPFDKARVEDSKKAALKALAVLEQHLQHHSYFVSGNITLADFFAASMLSRGFAYVLDSAWCSGHPNITRWYRQIINQPSWKAVVPSAKMIQVAVTYPAAAGQP
jgi:elongation factor 1-gamma